MKKIFKFELGTGRTTINLPEGAEVLSAQFQEHGLYLWVLGDHIHGKKTPRHFIAFGTGETITSTNIHFVGTACHAGGNMWHVFEDKA